ncbi:PAS domain-containing protein [Lignipirellula cremea]|uniref:PAS domain-containing protein n=1 Tax=Lignipirellula cremea TaxID=2528010 RepID=UPI0018D1F948|nr:PAS domain-containing protein [Lignipirellula cremea]
MRLLPELGERAPLVPFLAAIVFAGWCGGVVPAGVAAVLSFGAIWLLFPPAADPVWIGYAVSFLLALAGAAWGVLLHRAKQRAEVNTAEAQKQCEQLRDTFASIGDAVAVTDTSGVITSFNAMAEKLTGWTRQQALGQPLAKVFQVLQESTRQPVPCPAIRAIETGDSVGLSEPAVLVRRAGGECPVDNCAAPVRNADGQITGSVLVYRDVGRRRRAEQDLLESEQRYRLVGEAANDAIWDWDLVTNQVVWNAGEQARFGYVGEQFGDDADWWSAHIHQDDRDRVLESIHAAIDNGDRLWQAEYRFQKVDGAYAAVFDRGRILHDSAGRPSRMVGSMLDLSEKQQIEQELREARSRLASTLAAAEIGTWEFDPVNKVVRADANLDRMFGVSPNDKNNGVLEAYTQAIHPDDRDRVANAIREALQADEVYTTEYRILDRKGGIRWVLARGRVERDEAGQAIRLPGVVVDITERKHFEKALQASERQLRLALDSGELGSWNIDPVTNHLATDERFRMIFRNSVEPITYEEAFAAIHPDDLERVRERVAAATRPVDPAPFAEEYRVIHPNGEIRWVFGKGRGNFEQIDGQSKLTSFDGAVMDVTEQRKMREALRELAARLSEADRRKDEFLATLAHELRNPLAPIRTGLEALKLIDDDPEMREEIRQTMERQAEQMVHLIDDLLDVSRITRGKLQLRLSRVELAHIVRSAVEATRPLIDEAGHTLTVTLPDQPVYLQADPTRLTQVLANLLNNAAKYTEEPGRISLSAEAADDQVLIRVKDTGLGIPPDMKERIFEMFGQIDRSLERGYTGLGIGLTLVKNLAEMHQGAIAVQSEGAGQGSEFTLTLPRFTSEVETKTPLPEVTTASASLRILIVDDNEAAATMLEMVVKILGNEVRTACDGVRALEVAAEFLPDVVLMDIGMPRMNGYEAAQAMRQQPWGKHILLVALTGWGQDEDRQHTRQAGFDHHLVKPAEPAALKQLLAGYRPGPTAS